jgi:hypothetical protein
VGSPESLVQALGSITGQALQCQVPLTLMPTRPDALSVQVEGERVGRDRTHGDGWDYDGASNSVVFYGPACDRLQQDAAHSSDGTAEIDVRYPCSARR